MGKNNNSVACTLNVGAFPPNLLHVKPRIVGMESQRFDVHRALEGAVDVQDRRSFLSRINGLEVDFRRIGDKRSVRGLEDDRKLDPLELCRQADDPFVRSLKRI